MFHKLYKTPAYLSSGFTWARSNRRTMFATWSGSGNEWPQPSTRARSFPVPSGNTPTWQRSSSFSRSMRISTQLTLPSPPHTSTRKSGVPSWPKNFSLFDERVWTNVRRGELCCNVNMRWVIPIHKLEQNWGRVERVKIETCVWKTWFFGSNPGFLVKNRFFGDKICENTQKISKRANLYRKF